MADESMKLPKGETCGSCLHLRRCLGLGFTSSTQNTSCDFYPVRFVKRAEPAATTPREP